MNEHGVKHCVHKHLREYTRIHHFRVAPVLHHLVEPRKRQLSRFRNQLVTLPVQKFHVRTRFALQDPIIPHGSHEDRDSLTRLVPMNISPDNLRVDPILHSLLLLPFQLQEAPVR